MTNVLEPVLQRELDQTGSLGGTQKYINDPAAIRALGVTDTTIEPPTYPEFITLEKYPQCRVRTKAIDLMKLKLIRNQFKLPDQPTYLTRLPSGKFQEFLMDEESAKANEIDQKRWDFYLYQKEAAKEEQDDRMVTAIFLMGTDFMDEMPTGWQEEQELLGIQIPTHPGLLKAHFLLTECTKADIQELLRCIMGKSGVTEKEVAIAEDSFRGDVHGGQPG